jgi:hypothetical protein
MVMPNMSGARIIVEKLIPEALIALISLSSDSLPKAIRVARSTAIGTDNAIIHAKLRKRYSKIVSTSIPFPRNLSIALNKKFMNNKNVIIKREKMKGRIISLIKYLDISLIILIFTVGYVLCN